MIITFLEKQKLWEQALERNYKAIKALEALKALETLEVIKAEEAIKAEEEKVSQR
jgi:hypothetical protein